MCVCGGVLGVELKKMHFLLLVNVVSSPEINVWYS